ncbi:hypothetical protein ACLOJK_024474 [Asimina triloba]
MGTGTGKRRDDICLRRDICLNKKQRNQLTTWTINAVVANDLYTDDSFVFSKAAGRIKEVISSMPVATEDDDVDEAEALAQAENGTDDQDQGTVASGASTQPDKKEQADPFGLDALLPITLKKDERPKGKKEAAASSKKAEEEESKRFLRSQREALILCLEIAARRYKIPWSDKHPPLGYLFIAYLFPGLSRTSKDTARLMYWPCSQCQTVIDILVKHAFDNIQRFTFRQRDAIEKLWASVREQQTRRKQGKSVSGKLDMNAFERLQEKYANEKISIRHAVGGGGDRRAEQWLG